MTRRHKKPTRDPGMRVRTDARTATARVAEESLGRSMPLDGAELSRGGAPRAVRARDRQNRAKGWSPGWSSTPSSCFDDESRGVQGNPGLVAASDADFTTRAEKRPGTLQSAQGETKPHRRPRAF